MTRRARFLSAAIIGLGVFALATGVRRASVAESDADAAQAVLLAVAADAQSVVDLRLRRESTSLTQRPRDDVYAQVTSALRDAGLSPVLLRDLSPEADRPLTSRSEPGSTLRLQSMRLTLEPVTPAHLGAFLARWQSVQPVW